MNPTHICSPFPNTRYANRIRGPISDLTYGGRGTRDYAKFHSLHVSFKCKIHIPAHNYLLSLAATWDGFIFACNLTPIAPVAHIYHIVVISYPVDSHAIASKAGSSLALSGTNRETTTSSRPQISPRGYPPESAPVAPKGVCPMPDPMEIPRPLLSLPQACCWCVGRRTGEPVW